MPGLIAHNRPDVSAADRAAVDAVLASGWIAQGPEVAALEARFVQEYRGGAACAVSSGTAALFLSLRALDAGPGTVVAVPTYACSALLNAVGMTGAAVRVADVSDDSFCLEIPAVQAQAGDADIIIAVHTFGAVADIAGLRTLDTRVIEDCCQAVGGHVTSGPVGHTGDAAVFSFYATKVVTGGQGGLVWSRAAGVVDRIRDYREFDGRETYVPRFNMQMTDFQAALVNSQMRRLDAFRARRSDIANAYLSVLPSGLRTQAGLSDPGRMVYRFVVVAPDRRTRDALRHRMRACGVQCIVPVERFELLHRYLKLDPARYPVAERLADTTLSLPVYPGLTDDEVARACEALGGFQP